MQDISVEDLETHRARILRHDVAQGLIRSKKHGADSATGFSFHNREPISYIYTLYTYIIYIYIYI